MKKIGILTQYYKNRNFGGLLQAYALCYFLNNLGYQSEQITFNFNALNFSSKLYSFFLSKEKIIHQIINYGVTYFISKIFNHNKTKEKVNNPYISIQNDLFYEFEKIIPHSNTIYTIKNIMKSNNQYDIFIIGSDQVWNLASLTKIGFFGEFVSNEKLVISYAASSGSKCFLPLAEKIFIKKLKYVNAISVRERTLKEYIESITNKKITVVLDPTFLLSKEEWLKISNPKVIPNKKYIFCYFLGGKSAWQRTIAQNYADKYGYEVIHLPYIMRNIRSTDKYLKGQGRYDIGPREFISVINNAECVFTDSFHGMAFSINFNKNFYVFNRDNQSGSLSMNSRITNMLDMLGLKSRYIIDKNAILDNTLLNYTQVNKILKKEKEKSIEWLLNALKN